MGVKVFKSRQLGYSTTTKYVSREASMKKKIFSITIYGWLAVSLFVWLAVCLSVCPWSFIHLAVTDCPREDTFPLAWEHSADPTMVLRSNFNLERL